MRRNGWAWSAWLSCVGFDCGDRRKTPGAARKEAFRIAGHARAADIGTDCVDSAFRPFADLARQRRAAGADAAHTALVRRDKSIRNARDLHVVFHREARPL